MVMLRESVGLAALDRSKDAPRGVRSAARLLLAIRVLHVEAGCSPVDGHLVS